jgi:hypothetical protein
VEDKSILACDRERTLNRCIYRTGGMVFDIDINNNKWSMEEEKISSTLGRSEGEGRRLGDKYAEARLSI